MIMPPSRSPFDEFLLLPTLLSGSAPSLSSPPSGPIVTLVADLRRSSLEGIYLHRALLFAFTNPFSLFSSHRSCYRLNSKGP